MADKKTRPGKDYFKKFISNPFCWLIILFGISAVYFYYPSKEYPELCVSTSAEKNIIVSQNGSPELTVNYKDKQVDSSIVSAYVYIWNNGKKAIRPINILQPVKLVVSGKKILGAIVVKESRPDIIKTSLSEEAFGNGILTLSWNILEEGDGCIIQLIYTGDYKTSINANGGIEDQEGIRTINARTLIERSKTRQANFWFFLVLGLSYTFIPVAGLFFQKYLIANLSGFEGFSKFAWQMLLTILILVMPLGVVSLFVAIHLLTQTSLSWMW